MKTRRGFIDALGRLGLGGAVSPFVAACGSLPASPSPPPAEHYDLVVIGSGFGGTMTALTVAWRMEERLARRPGAQPLRILMLERGTWWTTPVETMKDKRVNTREFLIAKGQPTQEWSSLGDARGMLDLVRRCRYSERRPQGLYDFAPIGKRGLFGGTHDGVSVLRASGVGGGSLIYSKILIRPPETLFDDPRWPGAWRGRAGADMRRDYYRQAFAAITRGVETLIPSRASLDTGLTGPSNILTRSAGLQPAAIEVRDATLPSPDGRRGVWRVQVHDAQKLDGHERELIDRARVFQLAMRALTPHYGTVDLSINDMAFGAGAAGAKQSGSNFCERQGRCNIGCLPGAGQTLNKQLMRAVWGRVDIDAFDARHPADGECVLTRVSLKVQPLAQVDHLSETGDGRYLIHYRQRPTADPADVPSAITISADRVVVAAGSLGTSELLLRSRQRSVETQRAEGLHGLSEQLGSGFSPNGDHIAFLGETRERVNLTFGPVTTSFGQFDATAPQAKGFHNVEDQGIPKSLSALAGYGFPVMQRLAQDEGIERYIDALSGALTAARQIFARRPDRGYPASGPADLSTDRPEAEDELSVNMMCIVAQGKDDANGQFRLEDGRLRMERIDHKRFHEDDIYRSIKTTLDALAKELRPEGSNAEFVSPFFDAVPPLFQPMVLTSHPLGGCPMGESAAGGAVDEWGRVFRRDPADPRAIYRGLYVADGSTIPSALGVNPALTISAVALRVADRMLVEWDDIAAKAQPATAPLECRMPSGPTP